MASIKEEAQAYEPTQTKNVADLEVVSAQQEIIAKTYKEDTEDEFTINVVTIDGEDYRVPDVVLKQLKVMVEEKPNMTTFKVKKEGTGLKTSYTVVPLD